MDNYYCRYCNLASKNITNHEALCELKNNYYQNEKKLLIIPFNKNLNNLKYWKDIIKHIDFLILQKDKNKKNWEFVMDSYFVIPDNNCFYDQFFQYILLYYNKLNDTLIYIRNDWLKIYSNYEIIVKDLNKTEILYYQNNCLNKNINNYLLKNEILGRFKNITKFIKVFFKDYEIPNDYKFYYFSKSFSVNKKLILYHSFDTWINFFSIYINTKIIELEADIFIDLLFNETKRRFKLKKTKI